MEGKLGKGKEEQLKCKGELRKSRKGDLWKGKGELGKGKEG